MTETVEILARAGEFFLGKQNGYWVLQDTTNGWMSDVPSEKRFAEESALSMHGRVLVAGLGIGLVFSYLWKNPKVTAVDAMEFHPEVVDLWKHSPYYRKDVRLILGDFWRASGTWDSVWVDIWRRPPDVLSREKAIAKARELTSGSVVTWPDGLFR